MKKLFKAMATIVLTIAMISNTAPLHAFGTSKIDFNLANVIPDQIFQKYISDQLDKPIESIEKADLDKIKVIRIDGEKDVDYANLKDITGYTALSKLVEINIKNTALTKLPTDDISDQDVYLGPAMTLGDVNYDDDGNEIYLGSKINDVRTDQSKNYDKDKQKLRQFSVIGQQIDAADDMNGKEGDLGYVPVKLNNFIKYDKIGENQTKKHDINLNGVLINNDGTWPKEALFSDPVFTNPMSNSKLTTKLTANLNDKAVINIENPIKSNEITFTWNKTVNYLGNQNPWSGIVRVPLTVQYKQDVTVDAKLDGEYGGSAKLNTGEITDYYEYEQALSATAVPKKNRSVQYWRLIAENGGILQEKVTNDTKYEVGNIKDVNHIHVKFTHIADIKNVTNITDVPVANTGSVSVADTSGDKGYDPTTSIHAGAINIKDGGSAKLAFKAAEGYELGEATGGTVISKKENAAGAIIEGYIEFNEMQKDEHATVAFKLSKTYSLATEVIENGITGADGAKVDQGKDNHDNTLGTVINFADKNGHNATEEQKIVGGSDRQINIVANDDYKIHSVQVYKDDETKDYASEVFKGEKGFEGGAFQSDQYAVLDLKLQAIYADYEIKVSFAATNNVETEIVKNQAPSGMDNGMLGGTITGDNLTSFPRGDNRTVTITPFYDKVNIAGEKGYCIESIKILRKNAAGEYQDVSNEFKDVVDGAKDSKEAVQVKLTGITSDYKIQASFAVKQTIDTKVIENGLKGMDGKHAVDQGIDGGSITINDKTDSTYSDYRGFDAEVNVTAKSGYVLHTLTVKNMTTGEIESYTVDGKANETIELKNVRNDYHVEASFKAYQNITTEVVSNGHDLPKDDGMTGGSITNDVNVISNILRGDAREIVINAKDNEGYVINSLIVKDKAGNDLSQAYKDAIGKTSYTITFDAVNTDYDIKVSFIAYQNIDTKIVANKEFANNPKVDDGTHGGMISETFVKIPRGDKRVVMVTPTADYIIEAVHVYNSKHEPITEGFTKVTNDDGSVSVTFDDIRADYKVEASFVAYQKINTAIVANKEFANNPKVDDGTHGGMISETFVNIPRGDKRVVMVTPNADYIVEAVNVYNSKHEPITEGFTKVTNEDGSVSVTFDDIRADYKVEASFVAYHNVVTLVVPNEVSKQNPKLDDGTKGGEVKEDYTSIPRGDDRIVYVNAKDDYKIETVVLKDDKGNVVKEYTKEEVYGKTTFKIELSAIEKNYKVEASFLAVYDLTTEIIKNGIEFAGDDGLTGGTISKGDTGINKGDDRSVVIKANEDYMIHKVIIDGVEVEIDPDTKDFKYTFEDIAANHDVKVSFKKKVPVTTEIYGDHPDGGTISDPVELPDGEGYTVTITPKLGYKVDIDSLKSTGGKIIVNDDGSVTVIFDHVTKAEHVKVAFIKDEKPVTPPAKPNPPTGDATDVMPFAGLAIVSFIVCGFVLRKRKTSMK